MAGRIRTKRLVLRPWEHSDLDALTAIFAKHEVWRFPLGRGMTPQETEGFLVVRLHEQETRGWAEWAAEDAGTGRLIGSIGLSEPTFLPEIMPAVEVGWRLDPDVWRRGLATEGAVAALDHGFSTLGIDEVVSICQPANVASERVMLRLGMTFDRETEHPSRRIPLRVYRLPRARWQPPRGVLEAP
ncbi:MAG: GNAT family N-acetyltransferase [Acidimicrobiales bacterium]